MARRSHRLIHFLKWPRPRCHALACITLSIVLATQTRGVEPVSDVSQHQVEYSKQLLELAKWCDEHQLAKQAQLTRNWLPRQDPLRDYVFVIPADSDPPADLVGSASAQEWWSRFTSLRQAQAEKLFELAESAAKEKRPTAAVQLARETLRENPDHELARRILGFDRHADRWATPRAALWLKAGKVWNDQFGWLPADQLEKYQAGKRFFRGKWIDAAEDARLRSNLNNAWLVESEHYQVRTTHSLEEGVALSQKLEALYDVWRAVFVEYYAAPEIVEKWFASGKGPGVSSSRKPFTVVLFRDKQEYVDVVQKYQPQVAMSVGTYLDRLKVAYFFAGTDQVPTTIYHEATHQLFREERPGAIEPGRKNNFWIVEAIACYMESLAEHRPLEGHNYGMYYTLGGANEGRVPAARMRLQDEQYLFYMPLRELAANGMDELQRDPHLPQIYSQISGLAWFFMHADGGRYRPAFIETLTSVYTGRSNEATLEKLTGVKLEDLDEKYRAFMR